MSSISRNQFYARFNTKSIELKKVSEAQKEQLSDVGSSFESIEKADLNRDGFISGRREQKELFRHIDRFDRDGQWRTFKEKNSDGTLTPSGKVYNMVSLLIEEAGGTSRTSSSSNSSNSNSTQNQTSTPRRTTHSDSTNTQTSSDVFAQAYTPSVRISTQQLNELQALRDPGALKRVLAWRELVSELKGATTEQKINRVNSFFNRLQYKTDQVHWGKTDYWATPLEMLKRGAGDCEDYAIAKYTTLRKLGIPAKDLGITYVKYGAQAHMVLTHKGPGDSEATVLDNISWRALPVSRRTDLKPFYSFNDESLSLVKQGWREVKAGGPGQLSKWKDLRSRMAKEGRGLY